MSDTTYKKSGVDIEAGNKFIQLIKPLVESTYNRNSKTELGLFSGAYSPDLKKYKKPLLVASTDGVGTKLKVAFMTGKFDTIGIDLVAMCVNDIVTCGAEPIFFLDYFATSKLKIPESREVIKGIASGCRESGCVLLGGETAEMPGFYKKDEFDLAGFAVGLVDESEVIDGKRVNPGDELIGIESSGLHSNGYSLARKVILDIGKYKLDDRPKGLKRKIGNELLVPTRIYVKTVLELKKRFDIKSVSHITGGGLIENVPRVIPESCSVVIDSGTWTMPGIFRLIRDTGDIGKEELFRTFNCGIGLVIIVSKKVSPRLISHLKNSKIKAFRVGEVVKRVDNDEYLRVEID